jgi:hypothetical protein
MRTASPTTARPGLDAFLPVDHWNMRPSLLDPTLLHREFQYVSPDGTTFLPAGDNFVDGALYYGTKMSDVLRTFALAKAVPGQPFYVTEEEEHKTYAGSVTEDGTLTGLKLFAERGGESVTTGPDGRVYIATGQIYAYTPSGELLETINVPERRSTSSSAVRMATPSSSSPARRSTPSADSAPQVPYARNAQPSSSRLNDRTQSTLAAQSATRSHTFRPQMSHKLSTNLWLQDERSVVRSRRVIPNPQVERARLHAPAMRLRTPKAQIARVERQRHGPFLACFQ